jgi:hypothetical protein
MNSEAKNNSKNLRIIFLLPARSVTYLPDPGTIRNPIQRLLTNYWAEIACALSIANKLTFKNSAYLGFNTMLLPAEEIFSSLSMQRTDF